MYVLITLSFYCFCLLIDIIYCVPMDIFLTFKLCTNVYTDHIHLYHPKDLFHIIAIYFNLFTLKKQFIACKIYVHVCHWINTIITHQIKCYIKHRFVNISTKSVCNFIRSQSDSLSNKLYCHIRYVIAIVYR